MRGSYFVAICGAFVSHAAIAQTTMSPARPHGEAPQDARDASGQSLGDIIVTASRRSDTVRKTPIAVSAYAGQKLEAAQTKSLNDLVGPSPNIQIGNSYNSSNIISAVSAISRSTQARIRAWPFTRTAPTSVSRP